MVRVLGNDYNARRRDAYNSSRRPRNQVLRLTKGKPWATVLSVEQN